MNFSFFAKRNKQFSAMAVALMFFISFSPIFVSAQAKPPVTQTTQTTTQNGQTVTTVTTVQSGANGLINGAQGTQAAGINGTTKPGDLNISNGAPGSIGACVGSIASGYITTWVTSLLGNVLDSKHVPTQSNNDYSITGATVGYVKLPGWNAIAWCIGNALLTYITNSIVAWINNGFNGNPAFIANPTQYFKDIANIEAGTLINTIAKDATGLNICHPFSINVGSGLLNNYMSNPLTCSLDQLQANLSNPANYQVTVNGQGSYNNYNNPQALKTWYGVTQNPQNNMYGAYLGSQQQFAATIQRQQNTANINLGWNNGFMSSQTCPPSQTIVNQSGVYVKDQKPCKIDTPGSVIAGKLNNTLNLGNERAVIAEKFDQVVNALVGSLIRLTLTKLLSSTGK